MEPIFFKTSDAVLIAADYYAGVGVKGAILLHMMPATRDSWRPLVKKLNDAGLARSRLICAVMEKV